MDYLDPIKKKAHIRRLYIGYVLMGFAIFLATLILVYIGSGFVPGEDGIVQNGLIYVDSTPRDATVTLNGEKQRSKTDARFVVPGDEYTILLEKENYRPWSRTIQLADGKVRRLSYPRLYPVTLKTNIVQTNSVLPTVVSSSLDRKFLLLNFPSKPLSFQLISTSNPSEAQPELNIPTAIANNPTAVADYKVVEWTEDSRYFLLQRTLAGANEFFLLDRETPNAVRNLTREFGLLADTQLTMRDRSSGKYVSFSPSLGVVRYIELTNPAAAVTAVSNVVQMVSFESDKILYITPNEADTTKVHAKLLEGDKTYSIRELTKADSYLLEMAKFGDSIVLLVSSPVEQKASVYRNPTRYLKANPDKKLPVAVTTLRVEKPQFASLSTDASVVILYGDGQFSSHEFEADQTYAFKLDLPYDTTQELRWMDKARLNIISDDSVYSVDFEGSNLEKLVAGRSRYGVYFDNDYETMFSFLTNKDSTLFQITSTSLKAED